ncbi:MAG: radical SAM protein, partial [Geobacteraceae bacterium]|nr:radical SAM protein [Geobacteraceae bacterium]
CAGAPAEELEIITASFPLVVNLFPRSFLLLTIHLHASVSGLFSDFLRFVARMEEREGYLLTPDDCRRHMPGFAQMRLGAAPESCASHLPEMVLYESTVMEAANANNGRLQPTPSVPDWEECPPMWNPSAIVREFRYNLPAITVDVREGLFCERYGEERTILVFVPRDKGVDVTEINEFGLNLMQLSDGSSSTEEITRELYSRFGAGLDPEVFRGQCREAVSALGEMALLQPAVPFPDSRKEVITC